MDGVAVVVAGIAGSAGFVEIFVRLGGLRHVHRMIALYRRSWSVVRSRRISDCWKERVLPRYAWQLLAAALWSVAQLAAAVAALAALSALILFVSGRNPAEFGNVYSGVVFNVSVLIGSIAYLIGRRRWSRE